jgi:hypothetical protein
LSEGDSVESWDPSTWDVGWGTRPSCQPGYFYGARPPWPCPLPVHLNEPP